MPRVGTTYTCSNHAEAYQRFVANPEQVITLRPDCVALLLAAEVEPVLVTFDESAASATNGHRIIQGAQPVLVPLGYYVNPAHQIRAKSLTTTGVLHLQQLS